METVHPESSRQQDEPISTRVSSTEKPEPRQSFYDENLDLEYQVSHSSKGNVTFVPEHLLLKNQVNSPENIALFHAALAGNVSDIMTAISNGGKPNFFFRQEDSKNALHVAAEKGYVEVVEILLTNGAVVDCKMTSTKTTALMLASRAGQDKVVHMLIGAGAHVNTANCYGNRALHEACQDGHGDTIEALLSAGADPNAANKKGSTPLHFFCYNENRELFSVEKARLLLEAGADVAWKDSAGLTPLLVCCTTGRLDLIKLLLEYGADPTVRDASNQDALAIATFFQQPEVTAYFAVDAPYNRFGKT